MHKIAVNIQFLIFVLSVSLSCLIRRITSYLGKNDEVLFGFIVFWVNSKPTKIETYQLKIKTQVNTILEESFTIFWCQKYTKPFLWKLHTYETMNKRSKLQKSKEKRCNKKKYLSYVVGSTISRHYQISWGQDLYPQIWLKLGAGVILQMEKSYTWRYQVMTSKGWFCHGLWGHSLISLLPDIFF